MEAILPNQRQARSLVVTVSFFWAFCAIAALGVVLSTPALLAIGAVIGLPFGFRFYFLRYQLWEPETGQSPWRMMLDPSLVSERMDAWRHMRDLFRPSWIKQTVHETGWNVWPVGLGLAGLLAIGLGLLIGAVATGRHP